MCKKWHFPWIVVLILFMGGILSISFAQTTDSILQKHLEYTASGYSVYPVPESGMKYTKAPSGYKPFYISHYGRHGSRFHYNSADYRFLHETLLKADSAKALSENGSHILAALKVLDSLAGPRAGDLTQRGVKQHQGIAERMVKNFPDVFKDHMIEGKKQPAHIQAFASTSGRCILSMAAFLSRLSALSPKVELEMNTGKSLMSFINIFEFSETSKYAETSEYKAESEKLWMKISADRLMSALFNDSSYVSKNIDKMDFYNKLFEIRASIQSLDDVFISEMNRSDSMAVQVFQNIFTPDELINRWKAQNAWWYSILGTCPLTGKKGPDYAKATLMNILEQADMAIAIDTGKTGKPNVAASLRFGHDTGILPLASLMQLPVANAQVSDLSMLHEQWTDFKIIPMAANIQLIFFKAGKVSSQRPILVKVLYNEVEQTLPIVCEGGDCPKVPYYRWDDIREFYWNMVK